MRRSALCGDNRQAIRGRQENCTRITWADGRKPSAYLPSAKMCSLFEAVAFLVRAPKAHRGQLGQPRTHPAILTAARLLRGLARKYESSTPAAVVLNFDLSNQPERSCIDYPAVAPAFVFSPPTSFSSSVSSTLSAALTASAFSVFRFQCFPNSVCTRSRSRYSSSERRTEIVLGRGGSGGSGIGDTGAICQPATAAQSAINLPALRNQLKFDTSNTTGYGRGRLGGHDHEPKNNESPSSYQHY